MPYIEVKEVDDVVHCAFSYTKKIDDHPSPNQWDTKGTKISRRIST